LDADAILDRITGDAPLLQPVDAAEKRRLPPAYGGCTCSCHRVLGIVHIAPCCHPGKTNGLEIKRWR